MSAILSADELNDFISPGVACIKPVETLPQRKAEPENPYEVTIEEKLPSEASPAQISLTDCLACSGCVTSAEAVLVSLQSHAEVLSTLDSSASVPLGLVGHPRWNGASDNPNQNDIYFARENKIFVASVSPQVRASLAATYGVTEKEAGWMIEQLLSGPYGLSTGGKHGNRFTWVVDTNAMREVSLVLGAEEVDGVLSGGPTKSKKPILSSACPGWICYAEKTHPHLLPHLSRLKSPQALTGTLLKTVLGRTLGIAPDQIWHLAIMPCFDKKLEASRQELTDAYWRPDSEQVNQLLSPTRDVDCVITARELLLLAETRGISFPSLPRRPLEYSHTIPFPDRIIGDFLFGTSKSSKHSSQIIEAGSSGGFLYHVLCTQQSYHPGSTIRTERGRNADVFDYSVEHDGKTVFRASRCYGFRNIQNLVRKLQPAKKTRLPGGRVVGVRKPGPGKIGDIESAYVEVMACPGGCTNGGGQIKVDDLGSLQTARPGIINQKELLSLVDEAYYSMDDSDVESEKDEVCAAAASQKDLVNGISPSHIRSILEHWEQSTGINLNKLVSTSYREVESDVGKLKGSGTERVAELAGKIGGGW